MKRLALCIGINDYPGTGMDLQGCVNDAVDWSAELRRRGFRAETLLDAEATKAAIVGAMQRLIAEAEPNDLVAITFSGHGTYVFDADEDGQARDESDGFDEALCPFDVQTDGEPLTDDELHRIFCGRALAVRLLLIADSCHSGTVSRAGGSRARFLPPRCWMKTARLARAADRRLEPDPSSPRLSAFAAALRRTALLRGTRSSAVPPGDDVLLAGCMEGKRNFSYDASFDGRPNGAFTYCALRALRDLPAGASYADWLAAITPALLPSGQHPQTPQLVGDEAACRRAVLV